MFLCTRYKVILLYIKHRSHRKFVLFLNRCDFSIPVLVQKHFVYRSDRTQAQNRSDSKYLSGKTCVEQTMETWQLAQCICTAIVGISIVFVCGFDSKCFMMDAGPCMNDSKLNIERRHHGPLAQICTAKSIYVSFYNYYLL